MPANSPEEICRLFQQYVREGNLDLVFALYDPEAVLLNQAGEVKSGDELKQELATFAATKTLFDFSIKQVIQSGGIAPMHTKWKVSSPNEISMYAIEVARRQPDGTWRWLIGDPFTVGRQAVSSSGKGESQE
jgi:ketosteroid isomerase-like protein